MTYIAKAIPAAVIILNFLLISAYGATGTMSPPPRPTAPPAVEPAPAIAAEPQVSVPDIKLPMPRLNGQISVEAALAARGKVQNLQKNQLSLDQLGQLAFAVFGMPAADGAQTTSRLLDPIGMYMVLETGVYAYKPNERSLGRVTRGDKRTFLAGVVSAIRPVSDAPCTIVITGKGIQAGTQLAASREMTLVIAGKAAAAVEMQALAMGLGAVMSERIGAAQVTDVLGLSQDETPLCVIAVGQPLAGPVVAPADSGKPSGPGPKTASVLVVVPQKGIVDNEYDTVTAALKAAGFQVTVASADTGTYKTLTGKEVQASAKLAEVDVAPLNGVIFLGGIEARQYYQDAAAKRVASDAFRLKKTIGALSTSPRILANAGLLNGVRVAANITEKQAISREGGIVSAADIEQDNRDGTVIITATGSRAAAQKFSQQLVDAIRNSIAVEEQKPSSALPPPPNR